MSNTWSGTFDPQKLPSFEEELRDHLQRAPWLAVSIAFHALLFLVLAQFDWADLKRADEHVVMRVHLQDEAMDPPLDPPPDPPDPPQVEKVERVETPETKVDIPVVDEVVVDTFDEEFAPDEALDNAPFDSNLSNPTIGVGSNSGGPGRGPGSIGSRGPGHSPTGPERELALNWLARHQDSRGFWSCAYFDSQCKTNRCDGEGSAQHDVGVTGLSLLAFLGAGHTPSHGDYKKVVRNGLNFLRSIQDAETGCFADINSHQAFLYDHALAALAMTEAYWLTREPIFQSTAQKGIHFIHAARNPYKAWRYAYPPDGNNDVSVTGWMVLALKSAQEAGLKVDTSALDGARLYLDEMTDTNTWRTGYIQKGGWSSREPGLNERWPENRTESMTAVGMLCRSTSTTGITARTPCSIWADKTGTCGSARCSTRW